jgi:predicted dehydrogenase
VKGLSAYRMTALSELDRVRVLARVGDEAAPLLRWLGSIRGLSLDVALSLRQLDGHQVVLAGTDCGLDDVEARAVAGHLLAGGGVVLLGRALNAWARSPGVAELLGLAMAEPSPVAELLVRPVPGGPLADRLDPELLLRDRLPLGDPPPDAATLLTVPWHYADRVAGFLRRVGAGRCVCLGLGWERGVFAEHDYQRLVHRCLRAAAGLAPAPRVGVGLYGYGMIGRQHADAVVATSGLELRGICDRSPQRRTEAAASYSVDTHADAGHLLGDPSVDLVVVGVPPVLHARAVLDSLTAGKHVVSEKPFALRVEEVDRMLECAARTGRVLTVYQSRRWDPDFVALRQAVRRGVIGQPFYMESFVGGFEHPCSYWHSHEPVSGGMIYDWGSHYFDWVLQLFDDDVATVSAHAHKRVWHDITNSDQVRVDLTFRGGEQATFLQSDIAAVAKPKWYVLGTAGAIVGDWRIESVKSRAWTGDLIEERLRPAESPAVVSVHRPDGRGSAHVEVLALPRRVQDGFYRNLADHLLLGEPLAVRPEEARRNVAVMEMASRSIAAGGRQLEVQI